MNGIYISIYLTQYTFKQFIESPLSFESQLFHAGVKKKSSERGGGDLYILAASLLASSGFAAIGCFRASPYGGIYIMKNYSKLTTKKIREFFFSKIQNFFCLKPSPGQDWTNKKRIFQIGPSVPKEIGFQHTKLDPSAIYKGCLMYVNCRIFMYDVYFETICN